MLVELLREELGRPRQVAFLLCLQNLTILSDHEEAAERKGDDTCNQQQREEEMAKLQSLEDAEK
jgi:hypothetical protein